MVMESVQKVFEFWKQFGTYCTFLHPIGIMINYRNTLMPSNVACLSSPSTVFPRLQSVSISRRGKMRLNYISSALLRGAFPLAFPAVDGSLFLSLPVVALFEKHLALERKWEADSP